MVILQAWNVEYDKESELERDVGLFFQANGLFCQRFPKIHSRGDRKMQGPLNLNGSPDLYVIKNGRFYGVEIKLPKSRQSSEQTEFERLLRGSGANYFIVKSLEDAANVLRAIKAI